MKISERLDKNNPYFKAIWALSVLSKKLEEWKNRITTIELILNYYKKNNVCKTCFVNKQLKKVLDTDSLNIIKFLLKSNQIKTINDILLYFEYKILQQYKILSITIMSAFILNKKQKQQIIKKISLKFKKKIFIKKIKIKKNIRCGFIIKIKNIIIDCSIIGRLNKLKKKLLGH